MKTINAFVDTSTVNRILEIDTGEVEDALYEEDREYLSKIMGYVEKGIVQLIVNPSIKREIEKTPDPHKRKELLTLFDQFHFTPYNTTIFPFTFPAYFVTEVEKRALEELHKKIVGFRKDQKIFLDAMSNSQVKVLLTTDRKHLAKKEIHNYLKSKGLAKKILICTPKEFYEHLQRAEN